jgi:hypothetical protein
MYQVKKPTTRIEGCEHSLSDAFGGFFVGDQAVL